MSHEKQHGRVFRFAPSPNGDLHLGHAYSALLNAREAEKTRGRLLLRIENIDPTRARLDYEQHIMEDLAWLGLRWETPIRRQSDHLSDYRAALDRLNALGLVYPCFATRSEISASARGSDPDGTPLYPGLWRDATMDAIGKRMSMNAPYALRLNMQRALAAADSAGTFSFMENGGVCGKQKLIRATPEIWGDVIIARKDTPTSYHLSVVVDDALQGITHVIRGRDLFHATHLHRLLQALLNLPTPHYHHHELIHDASGHKLSKSRRDTSLRVLRQAGAGVQDIYDMIGL